jgi:NADH dehydrogenase
MLLIVGGTGYVGGYILEALEGKTPRSEVRIMGREGADLSKLRAQGYDTSAGNITNLDDVRRAMQGVDKVINLVAIIREVPSKGQTFEAVIGKGTENVAQAAKEAGVKHLIYMSALAATNESTGYFRAKMRGERAVKAAGVPYTIFRPSFLIGPGGEFTALLKQLTMAPIVPVIGPGDYPVQPLYVRDVARYFVQALNDERFLNQTLEVGGPETFEYNEMMRQVLAAQGKKGALFHAPLILIKPLVPVVEKVLPQLLSRDQLTMLLEGSMTTDRRLEEWGGFEQTPFRRAIEISLKSAPPATYAKAKMRPKHAGA